MINRIILVNLHYDMSKTNITNNNVRTSTISFHLVYHEEEQEGSEPLLSFSCMS